MSRIAFISTLSDVPWGGSEALWHQTALSARQQGHEVLANVQWWPETPRQIAELQRTGVQVQSRHQSTLRRLQNKVLPSTAKPDTAWLDTVRPDLVFISLHCHGAGLDWMMACFSRKIPYAVVVHSVVDHWWPEETRSLAIAYEAATALYFVSHANHRQVQIQTAAALANARIARNPFNVPYDSAPPWPGDQSTLRLACVGRLEPGTKGQDILISVLAQEKWKARDIALTLFGSGPFERSLSDLRDHFGLRDRVTIGGFTSNVADIWKTHHALALTSRAEGLPIVIVEAMLCGRACLVTDIAGNAELLQDNVSGFVAKAPKAECVDEALERLWQAWTTNQLQAVGQAAARQVRETVPPNPVQVLTNEVLALLSK